MRLDIVILPPKDLAERLGQVSRNLKTKYPLVFAVENQKLLPHNTLFHIKTNKLKELEAIVKRIAETHEPFRVEFDKATAGRFFFGYWHRNNNKLKELHNSVVRQTQHLSTGPIFTKKEESKREQYRKKYGTPGVFEFYSPHFTVGYAKNLKDMPAIFKDLNKFKYKDFIADNIAIAEVDEWWQVKRVIKTFKLGNELRQAVKVLNSGGSVVYPTDTAYGLAVDATNVKAVRK